MRTPRLLALALIAGLTGAHAPTARAQGSARSDLLVRLDEAWRSGAHRRVESILADAFKTDFERARDTCAGLIAGADTSARPLGAVLLARHLEPRDLAALARSLDAVRFPDERRRLVRAIGVRGSRVEDTRAVLEVLRPFLGDRDFLVRAAAASAMADLGRPEAVADLVEHIERVPAYVNSQNVNEREIFRRAACGATAALSGLRPRSVDEVRRWLAETAGGTRRATPAGADGPVETGNWNGQVFTAAPSFDVYMRVQGYTQAPAEGPMSWKSLTAAVESGRAAACLALERVAGGPVHQPVPRLFLCDDREFSARAGVTFFQGVTKSNEIVIRLSPPATLAGTMAHEYVHWIHQNLYTDQPRWMSEGLATSLSGSRETSAWARLTPDAETRRMIDRGVFTELFNWNSGGSSDSRESARYAISHLAVDFLRFGEFSVAEERLAFWMGRIARKESPTRALSATYGRDAKSMDDAARRWLEELRD